MYWAQYVLMDQAMAGHGGMLSTECPSCSFSDMFEWNPYLPIFVSLSDLIISASCQCCKKIKKIEQIHSTSCLKVNQPHSDNHKIVTHIPRGQKRNIYHRKKIYQDSSGVNSSVCVQQLKHHCLPHSHKLTRSVSSKYFAFFKKTWKRWREVILWETE